MMRGKIIIGDIQKDVIKMLERYDSSNYHLNIYYKVNKTDRNVLIEYNNNVEKITIDNNFIMQIIIIRFIIIMELKKILLKKNI